MSREPKAPMATPVIIPSKRANAKPPCGADNAREKVQRPARCFRGKHAEQVSPEAQHEPEREGTPDVPQLKNRLEWPRGIVDVGNGRREDDPRDEKPYVTGRERRAKISNARQQTR